MNKHRQPGNPNFFSFCGNETDGSLKMLLAGKEQKQKRSIYHFFTHLKPSPLYPQAESNLSVHPDGNKPLLLSRHILIYMLHSWLEAFH